jgi:lysophospholipase L1-like esterase
MLNWLLRLVLGALIIGTTVLINLKRTDEPAFYCVALNSGSNPYRVLVVGESWAAGGKVFPELPMSISDRLKGRGVEACSIGFSGRNSLLLYNELLEKFPKEKLYGLYDEHKPDKVILMTGVNDTIQHVGEDLYVEYTKKLVDYFSDVDAVEVISIPRVNERRFKPPNLFSLWKRSILRCVYDNCVLAANDKYRSALWRDHPELHMIEYDDFIDQYEGHEEFYTKDGVHLTDDAYHQYGAFLGYATQLNRAVMARN